MAKYTAPKATKHRSEAMRQLYEQAVAQAAMGNTPVENQVADTTAANAQNAFKIPGNLKELGTKALGFAKAHPYKAGGAAILGGINTAGLFDNSEIAGQAIGGVAGGVIPAMLGANPYTAAMISMGGGALGSLYDKLVAKKKQEEAMQQQMYNEQGVY
jgi:hypothetical protein